MNNFIEYCSLPRKNALDAETHSLHQNSQKNIYTLLRLKAYMPKKHLTREEEFHIMKIVLDKFLWLGILIMVYGIWKTFGEDFNEGLTWIIGGAIVLILFLVLIVKEYEIVK